jgi:hypothetical protein
MDIPKAIKKIRRNDFFVMAFIKNVFSCYYFLGGVLCGKVEFGTPLFIPEGLFPFGFCVGFVLDGLSLTGFCVPGVVFKPEVVFKGVVSVPLGKFKSNALVPTPV